MVRALKGRVHGPSSLDLGSELLSIVVTIPSQCCKLLSGSPCTLWVAVALLWKTVDVCVKHERRFAATLAGHLRQVIIAGKRGAPDTEALLDAAHAVFAPDKAVIFIDPNDKASADFWREHNPQALAMVEGANLKVRHKAMANGLLAAYCICRSLSMAHLLAAVMRSRDGVVLRQTQCRKMS